MLKSKKSNKKSKPRRVPWFIFLNKNLQKNNKNLKNVDKINLRVYNVSSEIIIFLIFVDKKNQKTMIEDKFLSKDMRWMYD